MRIIQPAVLAALCAACAGSLDDPSRFDGGVGGAAGDGGTGDVPGAPPACVTTIFNASCGTGACHGRGADQVDLISSGVAARLIDMPAANDGMCSGETYVSTGGGSSLLIDKLGETPSCGLRMPFAGEPLGQDDVDCLSAWVETLEGAAP